MKKNSCLITVGWLWVAGLLLTASLRAVYSNPQGTGVSSIPFGIAGALLAFFAFPKNAGIKTALVILGFGLLIKIAVGGVLSGTGTSAEILLTALSGIPLGIGVMLIIKGLFIIGKVVVEKIEKALS